MHAQPTFPRTQKIIFLKRMYFNFKSRKHENVIYHIYEVWILQIISLSKGNIYNLFILLLIFLL